MLFCPYKRKEEGISSKAVVHILLEQHCIYHFSSVWALFKKKPSAKGTAGTANWGLKSNTQCLSGRATVSCLSHTLHQMAQITPLLLTTCRGRKIHQLSKWNMQAALPKWVWNIPETVTASCLQGADRWLYLLSQSGNTGEAAGMKCKQKVVRFASTLGKKSQQSQHYWPKPHCSTQGQSSLTCK